MNLAARACVSTYYLAEAVPYVAPNLAPDCLALYLGCHGVETRDSVWCEPRVDSGVSSRRGAPKLQDEVCFLCLPPGFPAVPQYFVHTRLSRPPLSEPCLRYSRTRLLTLPFTRNHNRSACTGGLGRANMLTRMRGRGSGNRSSIRLNFSQVMPSRCAFGCSSG